MSNATSIWSSSRTLEYGCLKIPKAPKSSPDWSLRFGASLELGAWSLVLLWSLVLGAWCFSGAWCLELGAWSLVLRAQALHWKPRGTWAIIGCPSGTITCMDHAAPKTGGIGLT